MSIGVGGARRALGRLCRGKAALAARRQVSCVCRSRNGGSVRGSECIRKGRLRTVGTFSGCGCNSCLGTWGKTVSPCGG